MKTTKNSNWPVLKSIKKWSNIVLWEGRNILHSMRCFMFKPQDETAALVHCSWPLAEAKCFEQALRPCPSWVRNMVFPRGSTLGISFYQSISIINKKVWAVSLMQGTWTGRWWGPGRSGMLQSIGLQSQTRLGNWTRTHCNIICNYKH